MPVIAVVVAIVEVSAVVEVGVAAATVFELAAAAGAVIGAVGAVTGNKTLMQVGAVMGIAGAVGSFASSLGGAAAEGAIGSGVAEGATGATAGANAGELDGALGDGANAAALNETATTTAGMTTPPVADASSALTNANTSATAMDGGYVPPTPDASSPLTNANLGTAPSVPSVSDGVNMPAYSPSPVDGTNMPPMANSRLPSLTPPATPSFADASGNSTGMNGAAGSGSDSWTSNAVTNGTAPPTFSNGGPIPPNPGVPSTGSGAFDSLKDMFSDLGSFVKDNKELSATIFSGLQSAADPSQRNLRDAQGAELQSRANMYDFTRANGMKVPVVNWGNSANPGMLAPRGK